MQPRRAGALSHRGVAGPDVPGDEHGEGGGDGGVEEPGGLRGQGAERNSTDSGSPIGGSAEVSDRSE